MPALLLLACLLQVQPPQDPPKMPAKDLQVVPGPLAPTYPDPAQGPDYRGMEVEIRRSARRGGITVPTLAIPSLPLAIEDTMTHPGGWKAYRVDVAPKATVKVRLRAVHEAWFQVKCLDKWGRISAGMFQNLIPTGNPEASFINPRNEAATVFFIVDTTELNMSGEAYTLAFTASR